MKASPQHIANTRARVFSCLERLAFDPDRIPQLDEVSRKVEAISGFGSSLSPDSSNRAFSSNHWPASLSSTQYILPSLTLLYTPGYRRRRMNHRARGDTREHAFRRAQSTIWRSCQPHY